MPTLTTIVRGNSKENGTPNGRDEGDVDSGLSHVRPPPPPVPPPMGGKFIGKFIETMLMPMRCFLLKSLKNCHTYM